MSVSAITIMITNRLLKILVSSFLTLLVSSTAVLACDPCALYTVGALHGYKGGSFTASISEQFTDYGKGPAAPESSPRTADYTENFSTTQFGLGYDIDNHWALQLSVPYIVRRYEEIKDYSSRNRTESGLGDIVLGSGYSFLNYSGAGASAKDFNLSSSIFAGIKFPTGSSGSLEADDDRDNVEDRHHTISTTSGQRILTFGTGSYDVILALNQALRYERFLSYSALQYSIANKGDYDYEFDDNLIWSLGSSYFFLLDHGYSLAVGPRLGFEYKGKDKQYGEELDGTQVSNWFVGPESVLTISDDLFAQLAWDFRVSSADKHANIVPENRLLASLAVRF